MGINLIVLIGAEYNRLIHLVLLGGQLVPILILLIKAFLFPAVQSFWNNLFLIWANLSLIVWLAFWYLRGSNKTLKDNLKHLLFTILAEFIDDLLLWSAAFVVVPYSLMGEFSVLDQFTFLLLTLIYSFTIYKLASVVLAPREEETLDDSLIISLTSNDLCNQLTPTFTI